MMRGYLTNRGKITWIICLVLQIVFLGALVLAADDILDEDLLLRRHSTFSILYWACLILFIVNLVLRFYEMETYIIPFALALIAGIFTYLFWGDVLPAIIAVVCAAIALGLIARLPLVSYIAPLCIAGGGMILAARSSGMDMTLTLMYTAIVLAAFACVQKFVKMNSLVTLIACAVVFGYANCWNAANPTSPNHLIKHTNEGRWDKSEVIGTVAKEPEVREKDTRLTIKPYTVAEIKKKVKAEPASIDGGNILLTIYPDLGDLYFDIKYGDKIRMVTKLDEPAKANNPGTFDYQSFLHHTGYYALSRIKTSGRTPDEIEIIGTGDINPFVRWCLNLKRKLLLVIKQTVPTTEDYPASGFLGGVMLGLRSGVSKAIHLDSKASGTAHVFAVSGLHVTIIAVVCLMIFRMSRAPQVIWAPIVVLFLIIFTIITGGRPSTVRACMMNSFAILANTYMGRRLDRAVLIGMALAAAFILVQNPLILPEASFTLSFSAVLFLVLLSREIDSFLMRRAGNLFGITVFILVAITAGEYFINLENPLLILRSAWWLSALALVILAFFFQDSLPFRFGYGSIKPKGLRQFIAAQGAILAALVPIFMSTFNRVSIAQPFANFIAIPLIGIIIPLGMIAGILALIIPFAGIYIALLMNQGNWVLINFFLWMQHWFAVHFPFPRVPTPTSRGMTIYYVLLFLFIVREPLITRIKIFYYRISDAIDNIQVKWRVYIATTCVVALILTVVTPVMFPRQFSPDRNRLKVTFLDPNIGWSTGAGSCVLIEPPDGTVTLIDGSFAGEVPFTDKQTGKEVLRHKSYGEDVLQTVLLKNGITRIDRIIVTSPLERNIGGLIFILESDDLKTDEAYTPIDPEAINSDSTIEDFIAYLADSKLSKPEDEIDGQTVQKMYDDYMKFLKAAGDKDIPLKYLTEGLLIMDDRFDGKPLQAKVLNPPAERHTGAGALKANSVVILLKYGEVDFLLPFNITAKAEKDLIEKAGKEIDAEILLAPDYGGSESSTKEFMEAVSPEYAVFQYHESWKEKQFKGYKNTYEKYKQYFKDLKVDGLRTYCTHDFGAIIISTDGRVVLEEDIRFMIEPWWYTKFFKKEAGA
ncbi:MAG: ComEC/Rec2 family competence protein [Candidatus Tritonobacter lacicola]|nr:ComEC/Rec2 family competence protein [Candidatus Tritonobacter lacicola]